MTRVWAERGSRPAAPRDQRHEWAYIFGAVCPRRDIGAALVLPYANAQAMNLHLEEISCQVTHGSHAVLLLDGAGWHQTGEKLRVPGNISLLQLPSYSPAPALGIVARRTGSGRYVIETSSSRKPANQASTPDASICLKVTPSTPGTPRIGVTKYVLAANLVVEQIEAEGGLRLRLAIKLSLKVPDLFGRFEAHRQSPPPRHRRKRTRSQGPFLRRNYPTSTVLRPCPTPARSTAESDVEAATSDRTGLPRLPASPFQRAVPITPADQTDAYVDCFSVHAAFPALRSGRRPHCFFRGLLRLHSRYGPLDRSAAQSGICHEAPARPVTQPIRSSATRSIDNSLGGLFLHWQHAPSGRTVRPHVFRRHQADVVPLRREQPTEMMGAATSFHRDNARR